MSASPKSSRRWLATLAAFVVLGAPVAPHAVAAGSPAVNSFVRVATHDVDGDVAEIVAATPDGMTLIYTDSATDEIGFVDISTAAEPASDGTLAVGGSPTSVTVTRDGAYALVVVDTSPDFVNPSGHLHVVSLSSRNIVETIDMGGQPDSITISPDGRYAAVAIENQRNESISIGGVGGGLPQLPAGFLRIVDLDGAPAAWTTRDVPFTGLAALRFPTDPEPEFIDINAANVAALTLQENNAVALVDLVSGTVTDSWSAGQTTHAADLANDGNIAFTGTLTARREPDAIGWTPGGRLMTANEGDYPNQSSSLRAGSRDFTIFSATGSVVYEPGAAFEQQLARVSHYPDTRSTNKGAEPEGIEIGRYGNRTFAFVGAERAAAVVVYRIDEDETSPEFVQVLPTGLRPEGLLAIPSRNLFVTANEDDGTISIFQGRTAAAEAPGAYPDVFATEAPPTGPVWGALSGLSAMPGRPLVAVTDSFFKPSHILTLDLGSRIEVVASMDVTMAGATRNYDLEGIAHRPQGGYWAVSEGGRMFNTTTGAPLASPLRNLILRLDAAGAVQEEIRLPSNIEANQARYGFEGVAVSTDGSHVYVAFQREWNDPFEDFSSGLVPGDAATADPVGYVRIGRYTPATGAWAFWRYPLDQLDAGSLSGSWVGLSEIVLVDDTTLGVIERDNLKDDGVQVKRLYAFSVDGNAPAAAGAAIVPVVTKRLIRDLVVEDGQRIEKLEGMTILENRRVLVVSDNDGFGDTQVHRFGRLFD